MAVGVPDIFKGLPEPPISKIIEAIKAYKPKAPYPNLEKFGNTPFYQTPPLQDPVLYGDFFRPWKGNVDIVADECNFGYEVGVDLGFISSSRQVVWRNPFCQPPPSPLPLPLPDPRQGQNSPKGGCYCDQGVYVQVTSVQESLEQDDTGDSRGIANFHSITNTQIKNVTYPLPENTPMPGFTDGTVADFSIDVTVSGTSIYNSAYAGGQGYPTQGNVDYFLNVGGTIAGDWRDSKTIWTLTFFSTWKIFYNTKTNKASRVFINKSNPNLSVNVPQVFLQLMSASDYALKEMPVFVQELGGSIVRRNTTVWQLSFICLNAKIPPDPPPPPKKPPKMECCPGQSNNDALLRLILKRIGTLPVEVPASYLTKNGVQPAQTKQIESLVDFSAWFAERFDETIGEFEITIEVDDADLSEKGNQKQTIRLPNLGEAIAEIFSLLIHSKINNDLMLNIVNRNLIESGQIKQSEFKIFSALNALIEYVGFPTNSTSEKMPLTFKPGELSFDKFLKEGEIDVSVLTYTEKNTLAAAMHTLLQAAAIIRAVHFRKTPGNDQQIASTIKNDLAQFLGDNGNLSEQVKTFLRNVEKVYNGIDNKSG